MYMYQLTFDFNTSILRHPSNLGLADPNRSPSIGWFSLGLSDASQIQYTQPHSANPRFAHHCRSIWTPRSFDQSLCVFCRKFLGYVIFLEDQPQCQVIDKQRMTIISLSGRNSRDQNSPRRTLFCCGRSFIDSNCGTVWRRSWVGRYCTWKFWILIRRWVWDCMVKLWRVECDEL